MPVPLALQDCNNLHDAAKAGNAAAAVRLLAAPGASEAVNSKDKLKRMPLHLAAWSGSLDVTKLLVGASVLVPHFLRFHAQQQGDRVGDGWLGARNRSVPSGGKYRIT